MATPLPPPGTELYNCYYAAEVMRRNEARAETLRLQELAKQKELAKAQRRMRVLQRLASGDWRAP